MLNNGSLYPRNIAFIFLFFICFTTSVNAQDQQSSISTFENYFLSLKSGDLNNAIELTAKFPNLTDKYIHKYTLQYSNFAKSGKGKMLILKDLHKTTEDCSVIIIQESKIDFDPVFLVKQKGQWKVLLKLTRWDRAYFNLTDKQKTIFKALEEWYIQEKKKLQDKK